jgi:hypothetical protein
LQPNGLQLGVTGRHKPTRSCGQKCCSDVISRHSPARPDTYPGGLYSQCQGSWS